MRAQVITLMAMLWCSLNLQQLYAQCISGHAVMTRSGETEVEVCLGSQQTSVRMVPGSLAGPYAFAITDEQDNILEISLRNQIDFANAPAGVCRIYGVSWWGTFARPIGENVNEASFSDFCYTLSTNYVTVTRVLLGSGTVTTDQGAQEVYTCPGDGIPDVINFVYEGSSEGDFAWIITDDSYSILGLPESPAQDFEGAGEGVCLVWGLNYQGDLLAQVGDHIFDDKLATECYGITDDPIRVVRSLPEAGSVAAADGSDQLVLCVGDGSGDEVQFVGSGQSAAQYRFVITNDENEILGLPEGDVVDFDGAGAGVCRAWAVSFTGNFLLELGQNVLEAAISDGCHDLSDNYVEVERQSVNGGIVSMPSGGTSTYTCTQDGTDDIVPFKVDSNSGDNFVYLITSPTLEVLGIEPLDSHNFDGAPPGTCWVWGLAYTGELTVSVGDQADQIELADGCFDLSENFIEVIRDVPNGGSVSMPSGATMRYTCAQDGNPDLVRFQHVGNSNSKYIYVITSPTLEILGITEADSMDFDEAPPGTCWVWGLAYTGNLLAEVGDNAGEIALSDDCFDLSENFIEVIRDVPDGGQVSTPTGDTIAYTCTQDGRADIVSFSHEGASNSKYVYIITSPELEILGIETEDQHDFDAAPPGTCWVWGLAYTGTLTAQIGDNAGQIALSDDCFDLSDNFIQVVRGQPEAGTVSLVDGETSIATCTQDGEADLLTFVRTESQSNHAYIITTPDLEILAITHENSFDFDPAPAGTCWVWGLSYTGGIIAEVGQNAGEVALTSDCWALSENFIEVIREVPSGGRVMMPSGDTVRYTCAQNGIADIVRFTNEGTIGQNYAYVITSPDLEILGITTADSMDFDEAPPGTCWVWGLAYAGNLTAQVGDNAGEVELSDACFDLSDNFISVIRDVPNGGTVSMPSGATQRYTCTQDGEPDVVGFVHEGASNSKYAYIITSPELEILGVTTDNAMDFDVAPPGTCWVWGLAYTGNLTATVGENAGSVDLSDECFDLSDNFIEVIRDEVDGGMVSMPSGATQRYTCTQDGTPDVVRFVHTEASNSQYAYVITSPSFEVLGITMADSMDFDGAPPGTCWVWGLAYTGELTVEVGDIATDVALSDDCFDLSTNFIEVIRDQPEAGLISTASGDTVVNIVSGDGAADLITFASEGASSSLFSYIITDDQNTILGIPPGDNNDFEGAGAGTCRVWGLAYTGTLLAEVGDNLDNLVFSDDCYALSSNYLEVNRTAPALPSSRLQSTASVAEQIQVTVVNPAVYPVIEAQLDGVSGEELSLRLFDFQGRLISERSLQSETSSINVTWPVSQLNPGAYVLSVVSKNEIVSKRIVLQ